MPNQLTYSPEVVASIARDLSPAMRRAIVAVADGRPGDVRNATGFALVSRSVLVPWPLGTMPTLSPLGWRVWAHVEAEAVTTPDHSRIVSLLSAPDALADAGDEGGDAAPVIEQARTLAYRNAALVRVHAAGFGGHGAYVRALHAARDLEAWADGLADTEQAAEPEPAGDARTFTVGADDVRVTVRAGDAFDVERVPSLADGSSAGPVGYTTRAVEDLRHALAFPYTSAMTATRVDGIGLVTVEDGGRKGAVLNANAAQLAGWIAEAVAAFRSASDVPPGEQFAERLRKLCAQAGIPEFDRADGPDEYAVAVFHWDLPFILAVPHSAQLDALSAETLRAAWDAKAAEVAA